MTRVLRNFFALLSFLTPLPIPRRLMHNELAFGSVYLLPVVGFIRGLLVSLPLYILSIASAEVHSLTVFTAIAVHYIMQGFLHADGFIDFSEAILAHRFGVDAYKVVKDRYRGSYAIAIFTIFVLGLYSSMSSILDLAGSRVFIAVVIVAETWSPTSMIFLSYFSKEPPEGIGRIFKRSTRSMDAVFGASISIGLTLVLAYFLELATAPLFIVIAVAFISSTALAYFLSGRVLGFVNGDVLGFASELFYLTAMVLFAVGASIWT